MAPKLGYEPVDAANVPPPREIDVRVAGGISATVAIPHGVDSDDPRWATPTKRMVLILHGQMGHRDYCYQKILAHKLAAYRGMYSLRVDFRGCGALDDCADLKVGRVVAGDLEDITHCMEFITIAALNPFGVSFVPLAIVAHSRGAVATYLWAVKQAALLKSGDPKREAFHVPNLVNCSTRYHSLTMFEKHNYLDGSLEGVQMRCLRHGKNQLVNVPRQELDSVIDADLTCVKDLPDNWSVLSIYGKEDDVVSPNDGAQFSNLLSRCHHSHHLDIIDNADHMFMGKHQIESEEDQEDYNPEGWPLGKKNFVNYRHHVAASILHWLKPENELLRFLYANASTQTQPRWQAVDGLQDFRDIGGWRLLRPTYSKSLNAGLSFFFRSDYIYRSSRINSITADGASTLKKMGVKHVFDLMSPQDAAGHVDPGYLAHANINVIKSLFYDELVAPETPARRLVSSGRSVSQSEIIYQDILKDGVRLLRRIFTHIKDYPLEAFLISCANGQDLTGVVVMLILSLAGVDKHTIAHEHGLSMYGAQIHPRNTQNGLVERVLTSDSSQEDNIVVSMFRTLDVLEEQYGGVQKYMTSHLGFDKAEVRDIYNNLVTLQSKRPLSFPVCKI